MTRPAPVAGWVPALVSAAVARAALALATRLPEAARTPWERRNHAGDAVTLLEGPALVAGLVAAAAAGRATASGSGGRPGDPSGALGGAALVLAAAGSGALGALDDLAGDGGDRGLRGHLAALRHGRVTTGAVKVAGLAATGLAAAALADRGRRSPLGTLVGGAVVAAAANAVNLFDLRPGRALKVVVATSLPLAAGRSGASSVSASAVTGAALGVAADDLAARSMLGDTGANAAGAVLGLAVVQRMGLPGRLVALGALTALTLASERVSFTRVIAEHPVLRRLDEAGRATR